MPTANLKNQKRAAARADPSGTWAGKRVLFLLHSLEIGGAERQALLLATYLHEHTGAKVAVWGFDPPGQAAELCRERAIPCRHVPFRFDGEGRAGLALKVMNYGLKLRWFRPDVILPYTMHPNLLAGILWRFAGARGCVWQQRDAGLLRRPGRMERRALAAAPAIIANSTAARSFLEDHLSVPRDHIRVIFNGVHLPPPATGREQWRRQLGIEEHTPVACMVANLHALKDHETLLRAWHLVGTEAERWGPRPVLLLAGRFDDCAEKLRALALDLGLGPSVRFLGSVKDMAGLLNAVDLGVFSSRQEGCPNGVLECMAAGLAVAATDIPGTRDALGRESLGMLTPPGDAESLAKTIVRLLRDPGLRYQEGMRNRQRITQVFSPDRMCAETMEVIGIFLP